MRLDTTIHGEKRMLTAAKLNRGEGGVKAMENNSKSSEEKAQVQKQAEIIAMRHQVRRDECNRIKQRLEQRTAGGRKGWS